MSYTKGGELSGRGNVREKHVRRGICPGQNVRIPGRKPPEDILSRDYLLKKIPRT